MPSAISEKDKHYVWHPFTQMQTAFDPIPIVKAKGSYLFAESGERYLDAISSWWVNLHGHAHPYIAEKIAEQARNLEHLIFADFTHAPAVDLAERLINLLPGNMSKIFYSDNGSTAVEVALKMCLQYWHNQGKEKTKIICLKHSYHGDTFGAMSAAGKNSFNKPFWRHLFDVEQIDPSSFEQLKTILDTGKVACFIFEPLILGAGGMCIYPAEHLNELIKICKQYDVLTIADEVMTGFGRTGSLFACEKLQHTPDLFCLSKGLTGGFLPLGVTTCQQKIYDAFLSPHLLDAFLHGHSYTANPIACVSALASLDLLEDNYMQRKRIELSHAQFCSEWKNHPKLLRCESLGTILVLEYHTPNASYFNPLRDRLYRFFLDSNILLRPLGNVVYVMPPYCIQEDELQRVYKTLIQTLEEDL